MTSFSGCLILLFAVCSCLLASPHIRFANGDSILKGDASGVRIEDAPPGSVVRLHAFRSQTEARNHALFHAWADYLVPFSGAIDSETLDPKAGSFITADPRAFFWSGYRESSTFAPSVDTLKPGAVEFVLEISGTAADRQTLMLRPWNPDIEFTKVETPLVTGYFAAPKGASKLPVLITLHGSEGGSFAASKAAAGLFASHGFATLSLIYFAWSYAPVTGIPQAFDNLPIERISDARDWLALRPEADVNRLGIRGISKGSEFALIAAARYPWIRAVAGVRSDFARLGRIRNGDQ